MEELTAADCNGTKVNRFDEVFYSDSKTIDLKVGVVFAILRDNEILIEQEEIGNYLVRNAKTVGVAYKSLEVSEDLQDALEEQQGIIQEKQDLIDHLTDQVKYYSKQVETLTERQLAEDEEVKKNTPMIYGIPLKRWLKQNYPKKGMTQTDIAKEAGVTQPIISYMVNKLGLTRKYGTSTKYDNDNLTREQVEWLEENYVSSKLTDSEILALDLFKGCNEQKFKDYIMR